MGMRIDDLGELEGPVLVFGGPYSNLQALTALEAVTRGLGIAPGNMICTGDVVAYGADAAACVERVRALGCAVVAGNCERQLAEGAGDCGCGYEEGTTCSRLSRGWYAHAEAQVSEDQRRWMAGLPDWIAFRHAGRRWVVIHGGADRINRFVWPDASDAELGAQIGLVEAEFGPVDGVICGHSGLSFVQQVGGHIWLNAGVIGLPENDGASATRYALLDPEPRIARLDYDADAARAAMEGAGLVQGYHATLTTGYWPSEDILPPGLRAGRLSPLPVDDVSAPTP